MSGSCCEGADFDQVVGEHAVSAPGSGSVDAGEFGAAPAVASFDVVDPSFGSGPPFHLVAEGSSVFELSARGTGFTRSWDRDATHSGLVQVVFDRRLAVTAVGGDRAWRVPGAGSDPFDRRGQLRGVGRVPHLNGVVEDDPVGVVDDLGFEAKLDRLAQTSFADRAGSSRFSRYCALATSDKRASTATVGVATGSAAPVAWVCSDTPVRTVV